MLSPAMRGRVMGQMVVEVRKGDVTPMLGDGSTEILGGAW